MRSIAFPSTLLAVLLAMTITGCDVIRVDSPSATEKVIKDLYSATTVSQSEAAVRRFLVATEIGSRWTESPLRHYELTNKEIRQLAEAQLAFNRGEQASSLSADAVYSAASRANEIRGEGQRWMRTPLRPIYASSSEISSVVRTFAITDGQGLDASEHTLVSAIVAGDAGTAVAGDFGRESQLSPVQQFAYSVWLAHYGPRIIPFETAEDVPAAGKVLSSNFYMSGGGACDCFSSPANGGQLRWMLVRYEGANGGKVEVRRSNPGTATFFGPENLNNGDLFIVANTAGVGSGQNRNTIGNNVNFYLNDSVVLNQGSSSGEVHTSCSPLTIRPGETVGLGLGNAPNRIQAGAPFKVLAVESRDRQGLYCAMDCQSAADARLEACLAVPGADTAQCRINYNADINACHDQGLIDR
jgi:hypothetical protein